MQLTDFMQTRADPRVTTSDRYAAAIETLQESLPYTIQEDILGKKTYIFSDLFITKVVNSMKTNVQESFSFNESVIFDEYIAYVQYNSINNNIDIVRQLDDHLGGL